MNVQSDGPCCSYCGEKESDVVRLSACESCFRPICTSCLAFKSPIPFVGKTARCKVCKSCIMCYSNCHQMYRKNYMYTPSNSVCDFLCYSNYEECKCCGDIYNHCLHANEKSFSYLGSFKQCGEYRMTPLWVPDTFCHSCYNCQQRFTFFNRKHHCRICGRVFCKNCASIKIDLSEYGYTLPNQRMQRVCDRCYVLTLEKQRGEDLWEKIPFNAKVTVASFLPVPSVLMLSAVDRSTHREFMSRDFDQSFWRFLGMRRNNQMVRISGFLKSPSNLSLSRMEMEDDIQLSVRGCQTETKEEEVGEVICTKGCHWRLSYIEKYAIPSSIRCALFFVKHPVVYMRTVALKQLKTESIRQAMAVQEEVQKKDIMVSFIKCIQFCCNEIKKQKGVPIEIIQLLHMVCGCLMNTTQSSKTIAYVFRENEGITSILSLLDNDYINPKPNVQFIPESPQSSSRISATTLTPVSLRSEMCSPYSPDVKKAITYLIGILMNVCNLDSTSCVEVCDLNGIQRIIRLIQLTNDKLNLYCVECIRACCRYYEASKDMIGKCGGIIKLINCFSSTAPKVVNSAVVTTTAALSNHPGNKQLFRVANGMNCLMQIEESWTGKCSIAAAKTISNILRGDSTMVLEFLHQQGIFRINSLLSQKRWELSGLLFGHLYNCAMYSDGPIYIQAPLVTSFFDSISHYVRTASSSTQFYQERQSPSTPSSIQEYRGILPEGSTVYHLAGDRISSLSDEGRNSDFSMTPVSGLSTSLEETAEKKKTTDTMAQNIPLWLGYAAGAIRYLLNNEVNTQLFIDCKVNDVLLSMQPLCDKQGLLFISFCVCSYEWCCLIDTSSNL